MTGDGQFAPISIWVDRPADISPPPAQDIGAEIAIVGGGYTGLSAALRLRELGHDVVLLEQEFCGFGASGRNAGHLTPTIGKDIFSCIRIYGEKRGLDLIRFGEDAVAFTERTIAERNIACDYRASGNIIAGVHPDQRAILARSSALAARHGLHADFLDEAEMRTRGLPSAFLFGVHETGGGHLHPGKYVMGLRRAAFEAGVQIHEQTPVDYIEHGETVVLHSKERRIRVRQVLLATNAFTPVSLDMFRSKLAPLAVSLFSTPPLSAEQLGRLGWAGREGLYTAHESLESFRLTADNRLLGGSKFVRYGYGSSLPPADHPDTFARLEDMFRTRFPEIADAGIESYWSGWIALVLDFLPICGTEKGEGNIHYSMGYNGHGIAQASMMGAAMADRMVGKDSSVLDVLSRRVLPLPPEPFRWLAVRALLAFLTGKDRRLDRKIARENEDRETEA